MRAIIARESCLQQVHEIEQKIKEGADVDAVPSQLLEQSISVLHSLRMLTLHTVQCIIEWRKQMVYSYLLTSTNLS